MTRIKYLLQEEQCCPFHEESDLESACHQVAGWAPPGIDVISKAQCWSLMLADMALSSRCGQVSVGEWESMLVSPCITSVSTTIATLFTGSLSNDRDD